MDSPERNDVEFDVLTPDFPQAAVFESSGSARRWGERLCSVRVTTRIEASPERVFDAWLDPAIARRWLFATASHPLIRVAIDARPRGRFRFVDRDDGGHVEHRGAYTEIVRPQRLAFNLAAAHDLPATRVIAEIAPAGLAEGAGGHLPRAKPPRLPAVELTVTHRGVPREFAARMEARWTGMLYGLGLMLNRT